MTKPGMSAEPPQDRDPRVIIYDIPGDMDELEFREAIWQQNPELRAEDSIEDFTRHLSPKFRLGRRESPTTHWVLAVSPAIRVRLKKAGRIYIGWQRCRVLDFNTPTRCYKCLGAGHVATYCREQRDTCSHCGENHRRPDCTKLQHPPVCAPCRKRGKPHDHLGDDKKCPTFKRAADRIARSTNYGD